MSSLRVPFSFGAPDKQPHESTSPPILGPSGRRVPRLRSLSNSLQGNPLEAITNLLSEDYMKGAGRVSPERLVDMLIHVHYMVSPSNFLFLFWLSYFTFLVFYSRVSPPPFNPQFSRRGTSKRRNRGEGIL